MINRRNITIFCFKFLSRLLFAGLLLVTGSNAGRAEGVAPLPPVKIVSFGTSLSANGGWQPALQAKLAACLGHPVEIETIALAGSTSDWALTQIDRVTAARPDIVLIEFYANDAALNRWISVAGSKANFSEVLDQLRERLPQARLVTMGMNPMFGLRGMIRPFLASYIQAHKDAATARGAEFIDFGPNWARLSDDQLSQNIPDGLHPTREAAANIIVPELTRQLSQGQCKTPANP